MKRFGMQASPSEQISTIGGCWRCWLWHGWLVMGSAWHGAELVFRHGLGVDSNADEHGEAALAEEK